VELIVPVTCGIVIQEGKILFIRRKGKTFSGLLSLPGGKIDFGETIETASVREIEEETGVRTKFRNHLATIPEHITRNGEVIKHMIIHLCELEPAGEPSQGEFKRVWLSPEELESRRQEITPSDFHMVHDIHLSSQPGTYFSSIEDTGTGYVQKEFRRI
jgi:8-oxo-dGTP diphosphatase